MLYKACFGCRIRTEAGLHPNAPCSLYWCTQDWAKQLDYEESLRRQQEEGQAAAKGGAAAPGQPTKGFLSLTSKVDLNSMDVDLSEQLRARKKNGSEAAAPGAAAPRAPRRRTAPQFGSVPPTRVEQRAWERGGKFSRKVVAPAPTNEADQVRRAAREPPLELPVLVLCSPFACHPYLCCGRLESRRYKPSPAHLACRTR